MLPTPVLNYSSPHEMLYKTTPDFNGLKVFGSLCYASTLSTNKKKIDPRASKCVFIGFKRETKGCVLLNIQSRNFCVSRYVVFYEKKKFHIKEFKILAMKLIVLTFMIKFYLLEINLS